MIKVCVLFVVAAFFEMATILIWIFTWLMLTFKKDWSFKLRTEYKLLYWNWLYQNFGRSSRNKSNESHQIIKSDIRDLKPTQGVREAFTRMINFWG